VQPKMNINFATVGQIKETFCGFSYSFKPHFPNICCTLWIKSHLF